MHKAVFLDKDGTIVDNSSYPIIPRDNLLENEVLDGLKYLQERGFTLIIISNQSWISKGLLTKKEVEHIFARLIGKLWGKGIIIHDYFYCPHKSSDNCVCKKPKPHMIFQAARKHKIDLTKSYLVGDMHKDIITGNLAGVKTILVKTGCYVDENNMAPKPDYVIKNLNYINEVIKDEENEK